MKHLLLWGLALSLITFTSCDDDELGCTAEFVDITFTVEGSPAPDEVTATATGQAATVLTPENGRYVLVDDGDREMLEGMETTYTVEGTNGGTTLFSETFVVTADECHVSKVSGPTAISY